MTQTGRRIAVDSIAITGPFVAGSCADVGSSRTTSGRRSSKVRAAAVLSIAARGTRRSDRDTCPTRARDFPNQSELARAQQLSLGNSTLRPGNEVLSQRSRQEDAILLHPRDESRGVVLGHRNAIQSHRAVAGCTNRRAASSWCSCAPGARWAHVSPSSNVRLYSPMGWMYSSTVNLCDTLSRHSLPAFGGALPRFSSEPP